MSAVSNKFNSEQYKDVTDVATFVSSTLASKGHPNPEAWKAFLSPLELTDVCDLSKDIGVRRFLMNRALRLMLSDVAGDTSNERFCLVDNGEVKDWCRLFDTMVVKCIVENKVGFQV